jgi:hypothetical protein
MKIGITLGLKDAKESIWTNGIKQNVLMLVHLLKNSKKNYEVFILNSTKLDFSEGKPSYLNDIDVLYFSEHFMEMDLIICMGAQVFDHQLETFKKSGPNKKVISYKCGNNYVIHMENILFKPSENKVFQYEKQYDEIWYVPQQHEVNSGLYKTLYRTNAIPVPFIWSEKFLFESVRDIHKGFKAGSYKKDWQYDNTKEKKIIGIMEPNLNIVKFCLIPAMIAEESYRTPIGRKKIEKLRITNATEVSKHKEFMSIIQTFDLFKENRVSAESRYQTAYMLTQHTDILICHQILNPLNYLYLDAAYLGYPVLHNAPMCKDLGYYYEGSDTVEASKLLNEVLMEHDADIDKYNERNDKVLQRYHIDNENIIKTYDKLIENLFERGGNGELVYNPKTNLYNDFDI